MTIPKIILWYRLNIVAKTSTNINTPINKKVICNIVIPITSFMVNNSNNI